MQTGKRYHRIQLMRRSLARDAQGQNIETFATYATAWAQRVDVKSREVMMADQPNAESTAVFTVRWRSDMLMTDRILDENNNNYNIRQMNEITRHKGIQITATALVK